jgi:hypothetical protein
MQWYTTGSEAGDWYLGTLLTVTVTGLMVLVICCCEWRRK